MSIYKVSERLWIEPCTEYDRERGDEFVIVTTHNGSQSTISHSFSRAEARRLRVALNRAITDAVK